MIAEKKRRVDKIFLRAIIGAEVLSYAENIFNASVRDDVDEFGGRGDD